MMISKLKVLILSFLLIFFILNNINAESKVKVPTVPAKPNAKTIPPKPKTPPPIKAEEKVSEESALTTVKPTFYPTNNVPQEQYANKNSNFDFDFYKNGDRPLGWAWGFETGAYKILKNDYKNSLSIPIGLNFFWSMVENYPVLIHMDFSVNTGLLEENKDKTISVGNSFYVSAGLCHYFVYDLYVRATVGYATYKCEFEGDEETISDNQAKGYVLSIGFGKEFRVARYTGVFIGVDYYYIPEIEADVRTLYANGKLKIQDLSRVGLAFGVTWY